LILTSGMFIRFDQNSGWWTILDIPSDFEEHLNNLFQKGEDKLKGNSTFHVFWEIKDVYYKEGNLTSMMLDLLNLLNQTLIVLSLFCDPILGIFKKFKYQIFYLVVKNLDLEFVDQSFYSTQIKPEILEQIHYNYHNIWEELERLQREQSLNKENEFKRLMKEESKTKMKNSDDDKKVKMENTLKEEVKNEELSEKTTTDLAQTEKTKDLSKSIEKKQILLEEPKAEEIKNEEFSEKTIKGVTVQPEETNDLSKNNEPAYENKLKDEKIVEPEKEKNPVQKINNDKANDDDDEQKKFGKSEIAKDSEQIVVEKTFIEVKNAFPEIKFVTLICLSSPQRYSLAYLDSFSIDYLRPGETAEDKKIDGVNTIFDYIFSVYSLKPKLSEEKCQKIAKNLNELNEQDFNNFCKLKAKLLSSKSALLQKFFAESNIKVWDIYQVEKSYDDLESDKMNEIDKMLEYGDLDKISEAMEICGKKNF